ncbi:MAG TPA: flavin reductase family protein [Roseiarcus sp.]|nr:flavin reductase family protein [Roseiarcus sp.]
MPQRAALELVSSNRNRIASRSAGVAYLDALRQLPRAVSVVTFERGPDRLGVTATSLTSLSVEPPTIMVSFDRAASISPTAATGASFGVSILAASHIELADRFGRGALVEPAADESEGNWVRAASGVMLRSDAIAAFECESEEVIERHGRAIVIGRIRNVFKVGGSGALVYWLGAYNSIGWTDDEVRRAVGLFPVTR